MWVHRSTEGMFSTVPMFTMHFIITTPPPPFFSRREAPPKFEIASLPYWFSCVFVSCARCEPRAGVCGNAPLLRVSKRVRLGACPSPSNLAL